MIACAGKSSGSVLPHAFAHRAAQRDKLAFGWCALAERSTRLPLLAEARVLAFRGRRNTPGSARVTSASGAIAQWDEVRAMVAPVALAFVHVSQLFPAVAAVAWLAGQPERSEQSDALVRAPERHGVCEVLPAPAMTIHLDTLRLQRALY